MLSEAIIVTALTLLVGLVVWAFGRDIFFMSGIFQDTLSVEEDAKKALADIAGSIRTASMGEDGSYPIATASQNEIIFFADANKDGKAERIRYFLSGENLSVGTTHSTGNPPVYDTTGEIVAVKIKDVDNGTEPIFRYFDSAFDGTGDPLSHPVETNKVRLVAIKLALDKNAIRAPKAFVFETMVSIRNLKDNM